MYIGFDIMRSIAVSVRSIEFGRTQFWLVALAQGTRWLCHRMRSAIVSIYWMHFS